MDTCYASAYEAFWEEFLALRIGVWEMTSGLSPYSALRLVRQLIHCGASVYKSFWKNFSHFYLKRWIADPEVDSRLSVLPVFSAMLGSTVDGGESFSPDDAYDSAWNSVKQMKGTYTINYFQYQDDVGCVRMHNDASAASTIFAPTTTTTSSSS